MNAKGSGILTDPHPCGHILYPYFDRTLFGQAAAIFAGAGLRKGEGVVMILTADHRDAIMVRLAIDGHDVENYQRSGRLVCMIAEDLLPKFMRDGMPDAKLFDAVIGRLIANSRSSTGQNADGQVRIFAEMASLIWISNLRATISLEEMWNRLIDRHSVSLLCPYALSGQTAVAPTLRALHSHSMENADVSDVAAD